MTTNVLRGVVLVLTMSLLRVQPASGVPFVFTYQGQLRQGSGLANGTCDFQFSLFDAPNGGTQIAGTVPATTNVVNGLFNTILEFGPVAFTGDNRWMQIAVRCPTGTGQFVELQPRQPITPAPYAIFSPLVIRNNEGAIRANVGLLQDGGGFMQLFGPNGNANVVLSSLTENPNLGFVGVYNADGNSRASLQIINPSGEGFIATHGPNGQTNVRLSALVNNPNNGFISVDDDRGMAQAGLFVNANGEGIVFGDMKNFAVEHPTRPGATIMYTSLEGPEAAIYHRGRVQLSKGRATIELPEHFVALADADSITVQLTPGSLSSKGLAFNTIDNGRIEIGELQHGAGSYDVHFVVHAVRKGHEDFRPVLSKEEFEARFGQLGNAASLHQPPRPAQLSPQTALLEGTD